MNEKKKNVLFTTVHPAPYMDEWFKAFEKEYNLTVIYEKQKDDRKLWKSYVGYSGLYASKLSNKELKKIVKKQDFVMVAGWHSRFLMTIILTAACNKIKVAMFTDYSSHPKKYSDLFKNLFLYKVLDYIFCASQSTCAMIERCYSSAKGKSRLFPYMANIPKDLNVISKVGKKTINVLVANNFMHRKGYSVLFEALKLLSDDRMNRDRFVFSIVGHGEEYDTYYEMAKTLNLNITFKGWVEVEEYNKMMDDTDVYIHASLEEPFGIPPVDAMGRGKIVIASDGVRSMDCFIENGINGYLYPATKGNLLYEILVSLDTSEFEKIGSKAREDVLNTYTIKQNLNVLHSIL